MKPIVPSLLLLLSLSASAQHDSLPPPIEIEKLETNDGSLTRVENQPQFPGGEKALMDFMIANLNYPDAMRQAGVAGTVQVGFTIAPSGDLENVHVHRGISGGEALNEEALRAVRAMPRWKPAKVNGVAIPMDYLLPVKFEVAK